MKATTTTIALALNCLLFAQSPEKTRITTWPSSISSSLDIANSKVIHLKHDTENTADQMVLDKSIANCIELLGNEGGVIYLSEGHYAITETLNLPSNTYIIGDGAQKTTIHLNLGGNNHGIQAKGTIGSIWRPIVGTSLKGSNLIKIENHNLSVGDLIRIRIDDQNLITSDWAKGTVGQISKIVSIDGASITLLDDLRLELNPENKPELAVITPVKNCGILNLSIERNDATKTLTSNIHFEYTENAVVYGVESHLANFAHINNVYAYQTFVFGSHFHESFDYGIGGQGYGVVLSFTSSQCVLENNVFSKLRHAVLFQAGPNGNVVGYNYSSEPIWTGTVLPKNFSGDVVMHGNYPFSNLIEGNVIQNLAIDDSHGINGPNNVFMRNKVENAGIFMNSNPASNDQIFIGNEITGTGTTSNGFMSFPKGLYHLEGNNHFEAGNNQNGVVIPVGTRAIENSYYYNVKPSFFNQNTWPIFGLINKTEDGELPAQRRVKQKAYTVSYSFDNPYVVEILSFTLKPENDMVKLDWSLAGNTACTEMNVFRIQDGRTNNIKTLACQQVKDKLNYTFTDGEISGESSSDNTAYFVGIANQNGIVKYSDTLSIGANKMLSQNDIIQNRWSKANANITEIELYNSAGQMVCKLHRSDQIPADITTGIYYVRIKSANADLGYRKMFIRN